MSCLFRVGQIKSCTKDSEIFFGAYMEVDLDTFDGMRIRIAERCSFDPFLYFNGDYGIIDREKLSFIFEQQIDEDDTYFNEDLDADTKKRYRDICLAILDCASDPMWPLIFIQKKG